MSLQLVLNVDDSAANRYLKSRALRQAGFEVVEAGTGREAVDLALTRRPDLVLLDIKLPDMSGLDVCRLLKNQPQTEAIPVVHISATFVDEAAKASSAEAGADVYLAEPVGPHELASTVRTVMRLRTAERAIAESEQRLRLATEGAGIATWDLVVDGTATWSAQFYAMLGLDPATTPASVEAWLGRVREDERKLVSETLRQAMRSGGSVALEHWVRTSDGEERCLAVYGSMPSDERGSPKRLIGVAMDITARKRAEAERERLIAQARAGQLAAEEAARMKDEFLAILSHELRTPMSAVLGWLHLARSGRLSPEQQQQALDTVERNARLQSQLVNDLLDVSRIITGKLEPEVGLAPIETALEEAVQSARLAAGTRTIGFTSNLEAGRWAVRGSAVRLQQIFGNLLSNAIKFSPEGSTIDVRLERRGNEACVMVLDRGEGIAPDVLPRIFDIFRQADSSQRRRRGGLGLGLAIVKSLVELYGGRVQVESAGRGQGASFTVFLPLVAVDATQSVAAPDTESSLRGIGVLLVDDEADHLEMTSQMLRMEGATVATGSGASEALIAIRGWRPDVLVLDIAMPGTDGYQLLELIRRRLEAAPEALPAIALTGFASASDAARARAAGFQKHLAKPFDLDDLVRLVAELAPGARGHAAGRN